MTPHIALYRDEMGKVLAKDHGQASIQSLRQQGHQGHLALDLLEHSEDPLRLDILQLGLRCTTLHKE